jgi:hypothetical protein
VVAAGAAVALHRLVGLDVADLDRVVGVQEHQRGNITHTSARAMTTMAAATNHTSLPRFTRLR